MDFLEARDQGIWNGIQAHRMPWLDPIMVAVSFLGSPLFLLAVAMIVGLILCARKRFRDTGWLTCALFGGYLLVWLVREAVGRVRPEPSFPLEPLDPSPCFPSERAFLATALFSTLAFIIGSRLGEKPREWLMVAVIGLVLAIGVSRMYLGVCFFTDVVAGWLGGAAWALICQRVGEKQGEGANNSPNQKAALTPTEERN